MKRYRLRGIVRMRWNVDEIVEGKNSDDAIKRLIDRLYAQDGEDNTDDLYFEEVKEEEDVRK